MTSIQVTDIKKFMKSILVNDIFDEFNVYKMEINSFCSFSINGALNKAYYTIEEKELLLERKNAKWLDIKPFAYQIIKGNKTPISMNIILMPENNRMTDIINKCSKRIDEEDIEGLFLNIRYNNKELNIVSSSSRKTFTTDKLLDEIWDDEVKKFLKKHEIS